MITVSIHINKKLIYKVNAVNIGPPKKRMDRDMRVYQLDDGMEILHNRRRGAVRLAIKMLRTLRDKDEKFQEAARTGSLTEE